MERLAREILHGNEVALQFFANLVRLNDVGMVKPRRKTRLIEEHRHKFWVVRKRGPNEFEDEEFAKSRGPLRHSKVDVGHTAIAKFGNNRILANLERRRIHRSMFTVRRFAPRAHGY